MVKMKIFLAKYEHKHGTDERAFKTRHGATWQLEQWAEEYVEDWETYDLSTPSSRMKVIKLSWEDGREETVNVTAYPQRLEIVDQAEAQKDHENAFGKDLSEP